MAEYIVREKAWRKVNRAKNIEEALNFIDSIPTADVVEVKHGEWVYWQPNGIDHLWKCSVCNGAISTPMKFVAEYIKYCEHCGAKMDLKGGADNGK